MDVYVIDTGINTAHSQFEGRAHWGTTIVKGEDDEDNHGHGTHVAGTIASRTYGVAKAAHVYAVKVVGAQGGGLMSDIIGGVDWTVKQANAKADAAAQELARIGKAAHKGSVINMSVGGPRSQAMNDAVNAAVDAGIHVAVAGGTSCVHDIECLSILIQRS